MVFNGGLLGVIIGFLQGKAEVTFFERALLGLYALDAAVVFWLVRFAVPPEYAALAWAASVFGVMPYSNSPNHSPS